jgi:hypothetical protein
VTRFSVERIEEIGAKLSEAADQLSMHKPGALRGA